MYSALLRNAPKMRSDMDHTVLPANYTMPAFTPQPQNITAAYKKRCEKRASRTTATGSTPFPTSS